MNHLLTWALARLRTTYLARGADLKGPYGQLVAAAIIGRDVDANLTAYKQALKQVMDGSDPPGGEVWDLLVRVSRALDITSQESAAMALNEAMQTYLTAEIEQGEALLALHHARR